MRKKVENNICPVKKVIEINPKKNNCFGDIKDSN